MSVASLAELTPMDILREAVSSQQQQQAYSYNTSSPQSAAQSRNQKPAQQPPYAAHSQGPEQPEESAEELLERLEGTGVSSDLIAQLRSALAAGGGQ